MRTILSSFELDAQRRTLVQELAGVDDRQLLDIGLVRGADGSLRLAADPARLVAPSTLKRRAQALGGALAGLFRWFRGLPLKSPDCHPRFFLRE